MPAAITGVTGVPAAPAAKKTDTTMGKDDFLKLLVAQMSHQDPLAPQDQSQSIAQMAQFSLVEQMSNMTKAMEELMGHTRQSEAVNLVGHTVTYKAADGTSTTGVVEKVEFGEDGKPELTIGGVEGISPSKLTEVR